MLVLAGGGAIGALLGIGVAQVLVKVLQDVLDPPPEHLMMPWGYLAFLCFAAVLSTIIAVQGVKGISQRRLVEELRKF